MLSQSTGMIAIDTAGNASYSDLAWKAPLWSKLSPSSNRRFYLTPLTNFSSYQSVLTFSHPYKNIGLYDIAITFNSSNQTFVQSVNVTDCKFYNIFEFLLLVSKLIFSKSKKSGFINF